MKAWVGVTSCVWILGCEEALDPSGSFEGSAHEYISSVSDREKPPRGGKHEPISVEKLADQTFKVRFGECWATVSRPKHKMDSRWELIEGNTCATKAGDYKISGGFMQVWDEGTISFSFDGLTLDDRLGPQSLLRQANCLR